MFNIKEKLNRFLDDLEEVESTEETKIVNDAQDFKAKQAELSKYLDTLKGETNTEAVKSVNVKTTIEPVKMEVPSFKMSEAKTEPTIAPRIREMEPVVIDRQTQSHESSIFTEDVVITGDITTSDPIQFNGYMKGNVESSSRITLQGTLDGNIKSISAQINSSTINGSVSCSQNVVITGRSQVNGDIYNENLAFDGIISGNIYSKGKVQIDQNAEIYGNVTASTISIDEGAIVQGHVKINTTHK